MSFDWENYLLFAEKLLSIAEGKITCPELDDPEPILRSVISRAYYAVYHQALEFLLTNTNFQLQKYDSHIQVINAFSTSIYRERKSIYPMFLALKSLRIKADYEADFAKSSQDPVLELKNSAVRAIRDAKRVTEMIRNFTPRNNRNI
jgi:uncharacterized protein (UPF0332 family)